LHGEIETDYGIVAVQDRTTREVATQLDHVGAGQDLIFLCVNEDPSMLDVFRIQPLLVLAGQIDWTIELVRPHKMRGVEMRMRDCNSLEAAAGLDEVNRLLVDVADTVPQDVTSGSSDKDGSLSDRHLGSREDRPHVWILLILFETVLVLALHFNEAGPLLSRWWDELTRLLYGVSIDS